MVTMLPSWEKTDIYDETEESSETLIPEISTTCNPYRRRVVLAGGLICGFFQACTVAGLQLEVATSQLLEDEYGWDVRTIGLAIGGTFCTSLLSVELFCGGFGSDWIVSLLMLFSMFVLFCAHIQKDMRPFRNAPRSMSKLANQQR